MLDYNHLAALSSLHKERSFTKAALALHVTQSALSQKIKLLEQSCGTPLVIRTSPVDFTDMGLKLVRHFQQVMGLQSELSDSFQTQLSSTGQLRFTIAVNAESLTTWFIDSVQGYVKNKGICLEIQSADESQTIELLRSGKAVAAVSSTKKPPHGCCSLLIGSMKYSMYCSPEFKQKHFSKAIRLRDLAKAPVADYAPDDLIHTHFLRAIYGHNEVESGPRHFIPSVEGLLKILLSGCAYGTISNYMAKSWEQKGRLVNLFPHKSYDTQLYWHYYSNFSPKLEELTQWLKENATIE